MMEGRVDAAVFQAELGPDACRDSQCQRAVSPRPRSGSSTVPSRARPVWTAPCVCYTDRMDPTVVRELFAALQSERVDYVLIGALALDVLGVGRFTHDIDLFVRPTPENVERLGRALRKVWDDPTIAEIRAEDLAGEYPAIQYIAPDGTEIDLVARLGEAFAFDDLDSETHIYGDVEVRSATARTLYRMKRDTVRLQDKADAEVLKQRFDLED